MNGQYSAKFVEALANEVDSINRTRKEVYAELQTGSKSSQKDGEPLVHWWRVSLTSADPTCPFSASISDWPESLDYVSLDLFLPDEMMWAQYAVAMPTSTPDEQGILDTSIRILSAISTGALGIATGDNGVTAALCLRQESTYSFYPLGEHSHDEPLETAFFMSCDNSIGSPLPLVGVLDQSNRILQNVPFAEIHLNRGEQKIDLVQRVRLPRDPESLLYDVSTPAG